MKIYLASGFFNPDQVRVVERIEGTLRHYCEGHEVFSPREGTKLGESLGKTYAERKASAAAIFKRNIDAMEWADVMVAVVDGSDTGTMFEIGFFNGRDKRVVSYTDLSKPLNIMLTEAVVAHVHGIEELKALFDDFTEDNCLKFQQFTDFI